MKSHNTIYEGNLTIRTIEDANKYNNLTEINGDLSIYASAKLDAPKLESVGGHLSIYASAKLDALKSVGGYLSIYASAKLDALKSVGGHLYINASAKLDAPKLESVGGHLYIYASAKLDALKSVGGHLYINAKGELIANRLYTGGYSKFRVYDSIGCVVLSTKQRGGVTILSCRHSKVKNQKVVGDKFYVAQKDGQNAHAKTIEDALREIEFKTGNRDFSQFKDMALTIKRTPEEWGLIYRMITGACQYGVRDFIGKRGKLKRQYTLKEIIAETKGAYGNAKFSEVTIGSGNG